MEMLDDFCQTMSYNSTTNTHSLLNSTYLNISSIFRPDQQVHSVFAWHSGSVLRAEEDHLCQGEYATLFILYIQINFTG